MSNLLVDDASQESLHELVDEAPTTARNDARKVLDLNLENWAENLPLNICEKYTKYLAESNIWFSVAFCVKTTKK